MKNGVIFIIIQLILIPECKRFNGFLNLQRIKYNSFQYDMRYFTDNIFISGLFFTIRSRCCNQFANEEYDWNEMCDRMMWNSIMLLNFNSQKNRLHHDFTVFNLLMNSTMPHIKPSYHKYRLLLKYFIDIPYILTCYTHAIVIPPNLVSLI